MDTTLSSEARVRFEAIEARLDALEGNKPGEGPKESEETEEEEV